MSQPHCSNFKAWMVKKLQAKSEGAIRILSSRALQFAPLEQHKIMLIEPPFFLQNCCYNSREFWAQKLYPSRYPVPGDLAFGCPVSRRPVKPGKCIKPTPTYPFLIYLFACRLDNNTLNKTCQIPT